MPDCILTKNTMLFLKVLLLMLVFITAVSYWTQDFDNQQSISRTFFPHPKNEVLIFESTLCSSPNIPIKPTTNNNIRCPQKPIVTVKQLGRLGNQMWEYISFWAVAKKTGREPYVPSCMIRELEKIFLNLPVPLVIPCILSCTGTSCSSNRGQVGPLQS